MKPARMSISVIIPVRNGGGDLLHCLQALKASTRLPDEVIVVDDASTDASVKIAHRFTARVLELHDRSHGPAAARNRGAAKASGEILVFIDTDVLIHPEALKKIEDVFAAQPDVAALFGSYDDNPPHNGIISLYKNLQHHYVHHTSRLLASTFWAGCGAVRRNVFIQSGGFDERYRRPSVEDIELGLRLTNAGHRILLCPDIQGAHLKKWKLSTWLRSDILDRAVPWTWLILTTSNLPSDLNLSFKDRLSALAAWLVVICLAFGFWFPLTWFGTIFGILALIALNFGLYRLFIRKRGIHFAACSFGLHLVYFLYSSLTFVLLFLSYLFIQKTGERSKALIWPRRISE